MAAPIPIPFSPNSTGKTLRHASGGRVVNAMAQSLTGSLSSAVGFSRAVGLRPAFETDAFKFRGALEVGSGCYVIQSNACFYVTNSGGVYTATRIGSVPGDKPVTLARNTSTPDPDVLCVHEFGISRLTPTSVLLFTDPDLPQPNSIAFLKSYFIASIPDGRFFVSGVNDSTWASLDYATAESAPDGLGRVVSRRDEAVLFGPYSIEFWTASAPEIGAPLVRATSIRGGIIGTNAVTGWEDVLPQSVPIIYVGTDNVVYALQGYQATPISTLDVQKEIETDPNRGDIRLSAYVAGGVTFIVLTLTNSTWVRDMTHGTWHERESYGQDRWKVAGCFYAFGKWLAGDGLTGEIYEIDRTFNKDGTDPLVVTLESGPSKSFPARFAVPRMDFDFEAGLGLLPYADETERNPQVSISWSDDSGRVFNSPRLKPLGPQGQYKTRVTINACGSSGPQGRKVRVVMSDPTPMTFLGASMTVDGRKP